MTGIETLVSLLTQTTLAALAAECKNQAKAWCRKYNGLHASAPAVVRFGKPNNKTKTVIAAIWCDGHLIQAETVAYDWTTAHIGGEIPLYVTDLLRRVSAEFLGLGFNQIEKFIPAWSGYADIVVYSPNDKIIGVIQSCYIDDEVPAGCSTEPLHLVEDSPEMAEFVATERRRIYDRWLLCTD